jgi:hypothetical protein
MKHALRFLTLTVLLTTFVFSGPTATLASATVNRPIADFLSQQGTFCTDDGSGGCYLYVPPDPNILGWNTDLDYLPVLFAGVDYAGLATEAYAPGKAPQTSGTVTERALPDGRREVTVLLHTKNANAWVIQLDFSGDVLDEIANGPTLFGHRPRDVAAGQGQALADTFLKFVFVDDGPLGAPLPDLVQLNNSPYPEQKLMSLSFEVTAFGPLTAAYGVAEGTPGRCTISQTGLFMTRGKGKGLLDAFPVENIRLNRVGR